MMHAREKSDSAIVAGKPTNKAERSATEPVEPRAETKGNANQHSTHRTQSRVRYADDFIIGFEYESDARRFLDAMRERLGKFALSLHPEKTRLIEFGRFAAKNRERQGLGKPETFNFLGFTFICSQSRRGKFQIKRKSRRDRMRAKLQAIKQELRRRIHQPIPVRENG